MSRYAEESFEKIDQVPLVQDTTHPDHTDDDDGAAGALVALDGAPVDGGSPVYSESTGKHTSQVIFAFVPTYIAPGETFTVPVNRQALFAISIVNDGDIIIDGDLVMVD